MNTSKHYWKCEISIGISVEFYNYIKGKIVEYPNYSDPEKFEFMNSIRKIVKDAGIVHEDEVAVEMSNNVCTIRLSEEDNKYKLHILIFDVKADGKTYKLNKDETGIFIEVEQEV